MKEFNQKYVYQINNQKVLIKDFPKKKEGKIFF